MVWISCLSLSLWTSYLLFCISQGQPLVVDDNLSTRKPCALAVWYTAQPHSMFIQFIRRSAHVRMQIFQGEKEVLTHISCFIHTFRSSFIFFFHNLQWAHSTKNIELTKALALRREMQRNTKKWGTEKDKYLKKCISPRVPWIPAYPPPKVGLMISALASQKSVTLLNQQTLNSTVLW